MKPDTKIDVSLFQCQKAYGLTPTAIRQLEAGDVSGDSSDISSSVGYESVPRTHRGERGDILSQYTSGSMSARCDPLQFGLVPRENTFEYTIVFDLDETLIWHPTPRVVHKRPHIDTLLKRLRGRCELILWTASTESMGLPALWSIDSDRQYFHHAIFRHPSWFSDTPKMKYCKRLSLLGRDINKTIIIENTPNSVRFDKENSLIISDFMTAPQRSNDTALLTLTDVLEDLVESGKPVQKFLKSHQFVEETQLCRRNNWGQLLTKKKPGTFYFLRESVPSPKNVARCPPREVAGIHSERFR
eukprot:TRINITY_DN1269_c0_g2_i1.p1 TRINITY_DN1269_c0_g2~~TRINITY_DN1269_c0_g2_i1.p1  ORF type:complete len:354 (+),score=38.17 TRINITY_DN1269_c0_g2_i1:161-1063(+)